MCASVQNKGGGSMQKVGGGLHPSFNILCKRLTPNCMQEQELLLHVWLFIVLPIILFRPSWNVSVTDAHTHTHMHTHTRTHAHTYTHTHTRKHTHIHTYNSEHTPHS